MPERRRHDDLRIRGVGRGELTYGRHVVVDQRTVQDVGHEVDAPTTLDQTPMEVDDGLPICLGREMRVAVPQQPRNVQHHVAMADAVRLREGENYISGTNIRLTPQ